MQKVYTLAGLLVLASTGAALAQSGVNATAPTVIGEGTELFFSEYDEGAQAAATPCPGQTTQSSGNERALEVYNPTTTTVNLDFYSVRRYPFNSAGVRQPTEEERLKRTSQTPSNVVLLNVPNTLASSIPYVLTSGQATLSQILNVADQLSGAHGPAGVGPNVMATGGAIFFNGNDAMALVRYPVAITAPASPPAPTTGIIVDIFGIIGNNPGVQWITAGTSSANQSLKRRPNVSGGGATLVRNLDANPGYDPTTFNITDEWEAYSFAFPAGQTADPCAQSYSNLGAHDYTGPNGSYTPLGLLADFNNAISFYPNPATTGRVNVSLGTAKVGQLLLINGVGKSIAARPVAGASNLSLDVSGLTPGLYFVRCTSADGKLTIYKELVVQ